MIRPAILIISVALVLAFGTSVHSQSILGAKSPVQQLQGVKAANQQQLEKQTALLLRLEELHKEATQIKFFAKRG
jgi:hypothetical protein